MRPNPCPLPRSPQVEQSGPTPTASASRRNRLSGGVGPSVIVSSRRITHVIATWFAGVRPKAKGGRHLSPASRIPRGSRQAHICAVALGRVEAGLRRANSPAPAWVPFRSAFSLAGQLTSLLTLRVRLRHKRANVRRGHKIFEVLCAIAGLKSNLSAHDAKQAFPAKIEHARPRSS